MKRIILFLLTNLAILVMVTLVAWVSGLDAWLARHGGNLISLLVLAALFGFTGSLISLGISRWMAARALGVRVIQEPLSAREQWLLDTVQSLSQRAAVGMPTVGVFDSLEPNAFTTGPGRDRALLAVSSALLMRTNREEIAAVLGHEMTHVANGDMVTLALLQGVLNTFVIFLSWIIGNIVDCSVLRDNDGRGIGHLASVWVTQSVLGILATLLVMWFSRRREFRADAGGARLAGRERMIAALEHLSEPHHRPLPAPMDAFAICGAQAGGVARLFMSHPPIDERIAALRAASP